MKVFIFRNASQNSTGIRLRANQISVENLCRYFREADRSTLYIKRGNDIEFPDVNGDFHSLEENYEDGTYFRVFSSYDSITPTASHSTPTNTPARSNTMINQRRVLASIRVVRADIDSSGRPYNTHVHNHTVHVNIYSEDQACVQFIESKIREEMAVDDLIVVGANGLTIYDQEGTRGVVFWKVGSRKLFAVSKRCVEEYREAMDADLDVTQPPAKRKQPSEEVQNNATLERVCQEIRDVKEELVKYRNLAFRHKFSVSFLSELEGCFSCLICKKIPAKQPLMGCIECGSVIGCQNCVNQWYSGPNGLQKRCPKCRCERGLSKSIIYKGFDELLSQIKNLHDHNSSSDDSGEDSDGGAFDDTLPIVL